MKNTIKNILRKVLNFFGYNIVKLESSLNTSSDFIIRNLFNKDSELIIFDIGANIGQSAKKYKNLYKNALLYSFEPSQKEYKILKNLNINNFKPFNIGFSNKKSQQNFFINQEWY